MNYLYIVLAAINSDWATISWSSPALLSKQQINQKKLFCSAVHFELSEMSTKQKSFVLTKNLFEPNRRKQVKVDSK